MGGLIDERYDSRGLLESLRRHLGDTRLAQATIELLITTCDLQARQALLVLRRPTT